VSLLLRRARLDPHERLPALCQHIDGREGLLEFLDELELQLPGLLAVPAGDRERKDAWKRRRRGGSLARLRAFFFF
jgi:hypothetical protein